jgi:hypothetical protein
MAAIYIQTATYSGTSCRCGQVQASLCFANHSLSKQDLIHNDFLTRFW